MLLLLSSTGAAYAVSAPEADDVKVTQQSGACTGTVKDAAGEPVIGASVVVKGTTNGIITDFDGNFSLSNVNKGDIIQVSFVGYQTVEVAWNGQALNITLQDDTQALDELVVVGYGVMRKSDVTGSISVAIGGMLKRHLMPETLSKLLRNELMPQEEMEEKQKLPIMSLLQKLRPAEKEVGNGKD